MRPDLALPRAQLLGRLRRPLPWPSSVLPPLRCDCSTAEGNILSQTSHSQDTCRTVSAVSAASADSGDSNQERRVAGSSGGTEIRTHERAGTRVSNRRDMAVTLPLSNVAWRKACEASPRVAKCTTLSAHSVTSSRSLGSFAPAFLVVLKLDISDSPVALEVTAQ
eukprot:752412-Hanusia_phi.AAC.4